MLKNRWFGFISAYFFWAISLVLALWLLILVRNTFPSWISNGLFTNPALARQVATIFDRVIVLVGGCGWLAYLIIMEQYFRNGVTLGKLWQRIARVIGILLLLIFLADAGQVIKDQISLNIWFRWLLLVIELGLGLGLIYVSRKRQPVSIR